MNLGDEQRTRAIQEAWAAGEEVRGWALSWDMVYAYLAQVLARTPRVRQAALVVRFEALCESPAETLRALFAHCELADSEPIITRFASQIAQPDYYRASFSPDELRLIREITGTTASKWGY
jgi:hypothetical protein